MDPILEKYNELEETVRSYMPNADIDLLRKAFNYADHCHSGVKRRDGSPYITHPIAVAKIAADLHMDMDTLCGSLLHDCIEDTESTHEEIAAMFSPTIAELVEGVTKLTRLQYNTKAEKQNENLRKMFMAMNRDIRVVLIKLCDRLHNMRTMEFQTPQKQIEKSRETLEVYAPLAHRLGMQRIKWELEDLSIRYLHPEDYQHIKEQLNSRASVHEEFMNIIQKRIEDRMKQEGIQCIVYGRVKHIYSLYRKMVEQHKNLYQIYDLYAFRIITESNDSTACYAALGAIHDMFNLVQGRFKDYISTPKPNGYQSLHTTVIGREGIPFEVQIRTREMHEMAEYGIAAHWKYKQGLTSKNPLGTEETFEWVRKLIETQADSEAEEFMETMKVDMFSDEVFVFTPNGDVISLPQGATPIDFAYAIHSQVGNHMTGAIIGGRMVPYDYELNNGDIVEIKTSKNAHGPSRDWMKICKSNQARNKIRQWLKKERREENIVAGRESFESELRRLGYSMSAVMEEDLLPIILKKLKFSTLDDMYAAIGYGGLTSEKAGSRVREEMMRVAKERKEQAAREAVPLETRDINELVFPHIATGNPAPVKASKKEKARTKTKTGILVEGLDNCLVKFANCCTPVPGDPVIGFITRGYGVSVHRTDCPNADPAKLSHDKKQRLIPCSWVQSEQQGYKTTIEITAKDRDNLTVDIAMALGETKMPVSRIDSRATPDGFATVYIEVTVPDLASLQKVMRRLNAVHSVLDVRRGVGR